MSTPDENQELDEFNELTRPFKDNEILKALKGHQAEIKYTTGY